MVYTVFMPKREPVPPVSDPLPFPTAYHEVGILAACSLDEAFAYGQNGYVTTPTGTWNAQTPVRSLSVGDVLVDLDGRAWRIESVGYRALERSRVS